MLLTKGLLPGNLQAWLEDSQQPLAEQALVRDRFDTMHLLYKYKGPCLSYLPFEVKF